jgi:hypothetical protein
LRCRKKDFKKASPCGEGLFLLQAISKKRSLFVVHKLSSKKNKRENCITDRKNKGYGRLNYGKNG